MQPADPPAQPTTNWVPDAKVSVGAAAIGLPVGIIIAFILGQFGIEVPGEVGAAIGTLASTVAAYFVPSSDITGNI